MVMELGGLDRLVELSFHCLPCMETCVLPNTQSVPPQAVASVQEVQQISNSGGDLGAQLRREHSSPKVHPSLPALGHRL